MGEGGLSIKVCYPNLMSEDKTDLPNRLRSGGRKRWAGVPKDERRRLLQRAGRLAWIARLRDEGRLEELERYLELHPELAQAQRPASR